ncbi:MAG TPA: hypothetical protein DCM86_01670 [Verrucomicrobiales bacterium]|nr:hypothetical protein [Verrucomicrobiales bacterium]
MPPRWRFSPPCPLLHPLHFLDGLLEGELNDESQPATTDLGQPSVYANRFSLRHQGRGNLALADGHAESLPGSTVVREGKGIFPSGPVVWTADPTVDPNDGE